MDKQECVKHNSSKGKISKNPINYTLEFDEKYNKEWKHDKNTKHMNCIVKPGPFIVRFD